MSAQDDHVGTIASVLRIGPVEPHDATRLTDPDAPHMATAASAALDTWPTEAQKDDLHMWEAPANYTQTEITPLSEVGCMDAPLANGCAHTDMQHKDTRTGLLYSSTTCWDESKACLEGPVAEGLNAPMHARHPSQVLMTPKGAGAQMQLKRSPTHEHSYLQASHTNYTEMRSMYTDQICCRADNDARSDTGCVLQDDYESVEPCDNSYSCEDDYDKEEQLKDAGLDPGQCKLVLTLINAYEDEADYWEEYALTLENRRDALLKKCEQQCGFIELEERDHQTMSDRMVVIVERATARSLDSDAKAQMAQNNCDKAEAECKRQLTPAQKYKDALGRANDKITICNTTFVANNDCIRQLKETHEKDQFIIQDLQTKCQKMTDGIRGLYMQTHARDTCRPVTELHMSKHTGTAPQGSDYVHSRDYPSDVLSSGRPNDMHADVCARPGEDLLMIKGRVVPPSISYFGYTSISPPHSHGKDTVVIPKCPRGPTTQSTTDTLTSDVREDRMMIVPPSVKSNIIVTDNTDEAGNTSIHAVTRVTEQYPTTPLQQEAMRCEGTVAANKTRPY